MATASSPCSFQPSRLTSSGLRRCAPAALDDQRRSPDMVDEMIELGGDVACVEIDHYALHLQDIGGTRLTGFRHRAGNDIDRRALARAPGGEGGEFVGRRAVRVDPDVVGPAVLALTLVHEATDRDQSLGIAEDHVDEARDLRGVRFHGEGIGQRRRVVEIPPGVEVDDLVVAHAATPQHRSA